MALFSRPRLPPAVAERLALLPGERVVAWGTGPGPEPGTTAYVVATDRALHLPDWAGGSRVPWDLVQRASWADGVLDVSVRDSPRARPRRVVVRLDDERELPVVVRERVEASIEVQQHLDLEGRPGGVAVAARRVSDTGELRWSLSFDPGLDGRDPALRAQAQQALAELRGALGL